MTYLVSPPEAADWRFPPDLFAERLVLRWPGAVVVREPDPERTYAVTFDVPVDGHWLDGKFSRDGQVMTIEGDLHACAEVALWLRRQIPEEQALIFYDQPYTNAVPLEIDADPITIATPFL